jgi:hypothetical protein
MIDKAPALFRVEVLGHVLQSLPRTFFGDFDPDIDDSLPELRVGEPLDLGQQPDQFGLVNLHCHL